MATSSLVIEELTGKKRRLELRGPGLPFQGAEWPVENRIPTRWNPGNPEATQHVVGPTDPPSEWEGVWRTSMLIACPSKYSDSAGDTLVVYAKTLHEVVDDIARGGQLLRVTWASSAGSANSRVPIRELKITRLGRIESYVPKFLRTDDLTWKLKFVWVSRDSVGPKTTDTQGQNAIALLRQAMIAQGNASAAVTKPPTVSFLGQSLLGTLETLTDEPMALMNGFAQDAEVITHSMKEVGDLVNKVKDLPAALLNRALDVATNAVSVANQFVDQVSRKGPEAICSSNKVSALTRAVAYYSNAQTQAQYMAQVNAELAIRLRRARIASAAQTSGSSSNGSDLLAVYMPHDGDTFLSISQRYYNADLAGELARANGLPAYTISPPDRVPVIVPVRAVLDRLGSV